MTDYAKSVFSNPELLRQKLGLYLKTPDKVELYALAAEKFFRAGGGQMLKFEPTWSWWAFFFQWAFFMYRRDYKHTFLNLIAMLFLLWLFLLPVFYYGLTAKYKIIKNFEEALIAQNDDFLQVKGGVNKVAIWLMIGLNVLSIVVVILNAVLTTYASNTTKEQFYKEQLKVASKKMQEQQVVQQPISQAKNELNLQGSALKLIGDVVKFYQSSPRNDPWAYYDANGKFPKLQDMSDVPLRYVEPEGDMMLTSNGYYTFYQGKGCVGVEFNEASGNFKIFNNSYGKEQECNSEIREFLNTNSTEIKLASRIGGVNLNPHAPNYDDANMLVADLARLLQEVGGYSRSRGGFAKNFDQMTSVKTMSLGVADAEGEVVEMRSMKFQNDRCFDIEIYRESGELYVTKIPDDLLLGTQCHILNNKKEMREIFSKFGY